METLLPSLPLPEPLRDFLLAPKFIYIFIPHPHSSNENITDSNKQINKPNAPHPKGAPFTSKRLHEGISCLSPHMEFLPRLSPSPFDF